MTILEHIYAVKNLLDKGPASDDSRISNRLIKHYLTITRQKLIKEKADKLNKLADRNWIPINCIALCEDTWHQCDCIPEDLKCKVLRTKYRLPNPISTKNGELIAVRDLNGKELTKVDSIEEANVHIKYSLTKKKDLFWTLFNGYIYIFNSPKNKLRAIYVEAVFEDVEGLENITLCNNEGEETGALCYDPNINEFPIDGDLIDVMYQITKTRILETISRRTEDNENNARSDQSVDAKE